MKAKRGLVWLMTLLGALGLAGIALAQISSNFDLSWHLLSGGGGPKTSANYRVDDSLGQWAARPSSGIDYKVEPGFWYGAAADRNVGTVDAYEVDDTCTAAYAIAADGTVHPHTFHDAGDEDWVKFSAQANKTYVIQVDNVGAHVDAVVMLYDACSAAPLASEDNAFGSTVRMEWNCPAAGTYYLESVQNDPSIYGEGTNYDLSVAVDTQPPSPPRTVWANPANEALIVQWSRSPEHDVVGYRLRWGTLSGGPYSGATPVDGADNTYHQITGLANGVPYYIVVTALDLSDNESGYSVEIGAIPSPTSDVTLPSVVVNRPSADPVYTTTVASLAIRGTAADSGQNLSRVRVRNLTNATEGWDNSLSGETDSFSVESVPLVVGNNQIEVTVHDAADNTGSDSITIRRLSGLNGAVVIVGGRDDDRKLQDNINYATRRAYRVFRDAGFGAEDIRYLNSSPQDADGDGFSDVISPTTPANVHAALQWAATRVGPGVPFYLYLMDHGHIEKFCAEGCSDGFISPEELDNWLDELEAASGCASDCLINVIVEACHSGSFIDRTEDPAKSISEDGRVVIASTDRTHNAYASAQGACFSDAFFSAVAEGSSLLAAFNQAKAAVALTQYTQKPWLDDNGDGLANPADGTYAADRYVASFFGTLLPEITTAWVELSGGEGTIRAAVERGDEPLDIVWAAVYAPSYQEPDFTSLDPFVPLIELEPDAQQEGLFSAHYNAFAEQGLYRVIIYAEDRAGNQAVPRRASMGGATIYLPLVMRNSSTR